VSLTLVQLALALCVLASQRLENLLRESTSEKEGTVVSHAVILILSSSAENRLASFLVQMTASAPMLLRPLAEELIPSLTNYKRAAMRRAAISLVCVVAL